MEYTYDDVYQGRKEAEYYAYKKCLEIIDQVIPARPSDSTRSEWAKETCALRALRGEIFELYCYAEANLEKAKHDKVVAEKDAMIEQLRTKLVALESKKE